MAFRLASAVAILVSFAMMPFFAKGSVQTTPVGSPVVVDPITGDVPPALKKTLSASLSAVVQELDRVSLLGGGNAQVLRLEANEKGDWITLVLTLDDLGGTVVSQLEATATRASADARVRALARQLLGPPQQEVGIPIQIDRPPKRTPSLQPNEYCDDQAKPMIVAGGVISTLGLGWFAYESAAVYTDLEGVPGGWFFSYLPVLTGSYVSNFGFRRLSQCYSATGHEVGERASLPSWILTGASSAALAVGLVSVIVGGAKGTLGAGWDHDDEDDQEDFERGFAPYRTTGHTAFLVGAGLEMINLAVLRPLVWRAAIGRAAARTTAEVSVAPMLYLTRGERDLLVPTLRIAGTF